MDRFLNGMEHILFYGTQAEKFNFGLMLAVAVVLAVAAVVAFGIALTETIARYKESRRDIYRVRHSYRRSR